MVDDLMIAKHIIFTGSVQGVGFRFTAYNTAKRYLLAGMVRNLPDGSVEMLIQGDAKDVSACLEDIKETFRYGLKKTKIQQVPYDSKFTEFNISF